MVTDSFVWTFTSTGTGAAYDLRGIGDSITFYAETSANSTATVLFQTGASTGSTSHFGVLGASTGLVCDTGALRTITFEQPLLAVRPRVSGMSGAGVRVQLVATGDW